MSTFDKLSSQLPPWASAHLDAAFSTSPTSAQYALYFAAAWAALVVYQVYSCFLYPRYFSPIRNMPGPKYGHWLLGQAIPMVEEEAGTAPMKWHREFGSHIRFMFPFGTEVVSFTSYAALKQILVEKPYEFPKPPFVRNMLGLAAGYGLLTLEDKHHGDMRRFMNNAFAYKYLEQQFEAYNRHIGGLLELLKSQVGTDGKVIEMTRHVNASLLDIISSTAFGWETDHLHNPEETLGHSFEVLVNLQNGRNMAGLLSISALPGGPTIVGWLTGRKWTGDALQKLTKAASVVGLDPMLRPVAELCTHMYRVRHVSASMLDTKLEEARQLKKVGDSQGGGKVDVLSLLVKASMDDQSSYRMSTDMIQAQVLTFLAAGHETTASSMAWALWELAKDQRVQKKLRAECQELLMRNDQPEHQDIKQLKYLDAVVNEVLRLRPPTPHVGRSTKYNSTIDGVYIPKGTNIYIPSRVVNTDPTLWGEDADDFRPERWETLPEKYSSTFSVLTFIAGAHHCIGERMARNELKSLLCALVAHFEFNLKSPDQTVKAAAAITMKPDGGLELLVKPTKMGQEV